MYSYSKISNQRKNTCHSDLIVIFNEVIKYMDISILVGERDENGQNLAVKEGRSCKKWPYSKHNSKPSEAIDAAPYPINFNLKDQNNLVKWSYFGGLIKGLTYRLYAEDKISHLIRWGRDWDSDNDFSDQKLNDFCHFELMVLP